MLKHVVLKVLKCVNDALFVATHVLLGIPRSTRNDVQVTFETV